MNNSRVIGVRLNIEKAQDREALAVWDDLLARGFKSRQIFTDALLRMAGHTPEMYSRESLNAARMAELSENLPQLIATLSALGEDLGYQNELVVSIGENASYIPSLADRLQSLENMLSDNIENILKAIKRADPEGLRSFAAQPITPEDETPMALPNEFLANARNAARESLSQRKARLNQD